MVTQLILIVLTDDYKEGLKIRKQPVAKIMFICLLLRNAYVTMNSGQAGLYMSMLPPTLEF